MDIDELTVNLSTQDATLVAMTSDARMECNPLSESTARCRSKFAFTLAAGGKIIVSVRLRIPANAQQGSTRRVTATALTSIGAAIYTTSGGKNVRVEGVAPKSKLVVQIERSNPELDEDKPLEWFRIRYTIIVKNEGTAPTAPGIRLTMAQLWPASAWMEPFSTTDFDTSGWLWWSKTWDELIEGLAVLYREVILVPGEEAPRIRLDVKWPVVRGRGVQQFGIHAKATDGGDQAEATSMTEVEPSFPPINEEVPIVVSGRQR